MNHIGLIFLLIAAYLSVFFECRFDAFRLWLGAQVSLLPLLMVYAGFTSGLPSILILGFASGYWYDSLSVNPFGVSVVPLILVGAAAFVGRDYVLRDLPLTQMLAGAAGSLVAPALTFFLLRTVLPRLIPTGQVVLEGIPAIEGGADGLGGTGVQPSWGWWLGPRLIAVAGIGALATPVVFRLFDFLHRHFCYSSAPPTSFRDDRQIIRGRR